MSFGQTLRAAREAKGITASELAARTHLLVQIVEGLENEDFRRIPAPIYGRGFVKLYCETVGLDPKPLQAEFMSLYSSDKSAAAAAGRAEPTPSVARSKPPSVTEPEPPPGVGALFSTEPPPAATPEPAPATEPEPPSATDSLFAAEPPPTVAPESSTKPQEISSEPPPRRSYGDLFEQAYAQTEPPKPSAADKFRDTMSNVSHGVFANVKKLPPNTGRMVTVTIAALLLLALIGWGISALYKATTPQPAPETPAAAKPVPPKADATPAKTESTAGKTGTVPAKTKARHALLPTKRATASGGGKTADIKPEALKASGIQIPSLYID